MTSDDYLYTGAMRLRRSSNKEDKRLDKGMLRMQAGWAVQMLEVWGNSVAVIDEVDIVRALSHLAPLLCRWHLPSPCMHTTLSLPLTLIWQVLHPLKSELNWPLGDKHALDFAPKRWELPGHLLEIASDCV